MQTLINLDIFDKDTIFTECNDTHFISNDFEQHSIISSSPLELSHDPEDPKQSYFEIKVHCGGYYDQVQIGLIFINQSDLELGLSSSSDMLNTLKNNGIIPGYEPLSIGFHGDDGKLYHNLSTNVCLETLIQRAKQDSERLLKEASTDTSIFDISNQMVYGGMYGPTFGSGDQIGCGIVSVNGKKDECAIFFTHNGLKLPAIRFNAKGILMFPIVSFKGKLCHIELLKHLQDYSHFTLQKR